MCNAHAFEVLLGAPAHGDGNFHDLSQRQNSFLRAWEMLSTKYKVQNLWYNCHLDNGKIYCQICCFVTLNLLKIFIYKEKKNLFAFFFFFFFDGSPN